MPIVYLDSDEQYSVYSLDSEPLGKFWPEQPCAFVTEEELKKHNLAVKAWDEHQSWLKRLYNQGKAA